MFKLWSELPRARAREQVADLATAAWVVFWGNIVWQLFLFLAGFAAAGRAVHDGGDTMISNGRDLGESLSGLPLLGEQVRDLTGRAFASVGRPLSDLGTDLEQFVIVVAIVMAILLALVTIGPWLTRYVPWRLERLGRMRSAHRVVRTAPTLPDPTVDEVLALRAITRLDYATLLEFTPDPLGDWAAHRHDRLARAELASVGLRPSA
jgi:hypothetical protein